MDFNDTPEEAEYRARARAWLDANAKLREPGAPARGVLGEGENDELIAEAKAWQDQKAISECQWLHEAIVTASRLLSSSALRMSCAVLASRAPRVLPFIRRFMSGSTSHVTLVVSRPLYPLMWPITF